MELYRSTFGLDDDMSATSAISTERSNGIRAFRFECTISEWFRDHGISRHEIRCTVIISVACYDE